MSDEKTSNRESASRDWRGTVFLPKTDFPMKAGLPQKEPGIAARWAEQDLYAKLRDANLVQTRRDAQTIYYSLKGQEVESVLRTLNGIYCS